MTDADLRDLRARHLNANLQFRAIDRRYREDKASVADWELALHRYLKVQDALIAGLERRIKELKKKKEAHGGET